VFQEGGVVIKLIYCPQCQDVVRLIDDSRWCECGESGGRYTDELNALVWGEAVPLGIHNEIFKWALSARPQSGLGSCFDAWVIPVECPTVRSKP